MSQNTEMKGLGGLVLGAPAIAAFLFLLLPADASSQPKPPPPPKRFFTDSTGVVPAPVAAQIEQRLQTLQKISSNQVLVVVADRLPPGYTSMEEYTNRTAQAWRAGVKGRDNGAVLFAFLSDRKVRLEVGYGLEGALPDALASRIINDEIIPRFQERNYGAGLLAGVDAIIRATRGEYRPIAAGQIQAQANTVEPRPLWIQAVRYVALNPMVLFLGLVPFAAIMLWYIFKDGGGSASATEWSSETSWSSSGSSSSSSSSDFSGGGGSFGGGGASGSW